MVACSLSLSVVNVHISFQPEVLFTFFSQEITNSLFAALVVLIPTIIFVWRIPKSFDTFKPGKFELFLEIIVGSLYGLVESIMGAKETKKYFPFLITFFIFILMSNWFPLLPGISSLGIVKEEAHLEEVTLAYTSSYLEEQQLEEENIMYENVEEQTQINHENESESLGTGCLLKAECFLTTSGIEEGEFVHLFRAPTADLSAGFALAMISVIVTNVVGLRRHKMGYVSKYINFKGPIDFFVGILEFMSEIGKLISFSFRLFGNIFAGEVLLVVITAISFGLATLPFLGLELFVGIIQALVFFMLTAVFMNLAIEHHSEH